MKTVVYLSNQLVKAVVGEVRNGTLVITQAVAEEAPRLSIVNGSVTDDTAFTQFLKEFWEKHQLPRKKVYLVVNSTQTVIRFFEAPKMSHRRMMEYLPREFADVERLRNPVYSYQVLGMGRSVHRQRVIGVVMERNFLTEHIKRFHSLGIRLISVEAALAAELRLLHHLEGLKGKVCAVQLLDGIMLMNILWTNGTFIHFNRTRIFSPAGTPQFGAECARAVSSLMQFAEAEQVEEEITDVYLGGLREGELEICEKAICECCPGISVRNLSDAAGSSVRFSEEIHTPGSLAAPAGEVHDLGSLAAPAGEVHDLGSFAVPAGGIFGRAGRWNLMYQYCRGSEMVARRAALFQVLAPPAVAGCLLTLILILQAVSWFCMTNQVNACFDYISDPLVLSGAARYDRLTAENEALRGRLKATSRIASNIDSYPVMDTRIDRAVERCARDLVTARVVGFEAEAGVIQISSSAADERSIHQFIDRLAEERDIFSAVEYTGFEYVESDNAWKLYVECYLSPPQIQKEQPITDTAVRRREQRKSGAEHASAGKGTER